MNINKPYHKLNADEKVALFKKSLFDLTALIEKLQTIADDLPAFDILQAVASDDSLLLFYHAIYDYHNAFTDYADNGGFGKLTNNDIMECLRGTK